MTTYARVSDGMVCELFATDEDINALFAPGMCWIPITAESGDVAERWTYDVSTGLFAAPVPYVPTAEETLATNTSTRDYLLGIAALAIAPLQDAVDLDMATEDETNQLKVWKQCRVALNRVDLTAAGPAWPAMPQ